MNEKTPAQNSDGETVNKGRRAAMRRMLELAVGAAAATQGIGKADAQTRPMVSSWNTEVQRPGVFERILDRGQHMRHWRRQLEAYQAKLRTPAGRVLTLDPQRAEEARHLVMTDHPPCFFSMLNEETRRQVREYFARRSVWLYTNGTDSGALATGMLTTTELAQTVDRSESLGYGGSILIRRGSKYYLATNLHVIAGFDRRQTEQVRASSLDGDDIGFYDVSAKQIRDLRLDPAHAVPVDRPLPGSFDLQGAPVVMRAFDPDMAVSGARIPEGHKEFLGVASSAAWEAAVRSAGATEMSSAEVHELHMNTFQMMIDDGESELLQVRVRAANGEAITVRRPFLAGCSGTGVAAFTEEGELETVGMVVVSTARAAERPVEPHADVQPTRRSVSTLAFYDRAHIATALNDPRRIFSFPSVTRS